MHPLYLVSNCTGHRQYRAAAGTDDSSEDDMAEAGLAQASTDSGERPRLENVLLVWRLQCEWVAAGPGADGAVAGADASIPNLLEESEAIG